MKSALELVEAQFAAYNAHDLDRFMSNFSDTVKIYRMANTELGIDGKAAMAHFYATERFNHPGLRAELLSRLVLCNKIFDRERIWGMSDIPLDVVAVFEAKDGLIHTMWAYSA